jgi:hypothetical protein
MLDLLKMVFHRNKLCTREEGHRTTWCRVTPRQKSNDQDDQVARGDKPTSYSRLFASQLLLQHDPINAALAN